MKTTISDWIIKCLLVVTWMMGSTGTQAFHTIDVVNDTSSVYLPILKNNSSDPTYIRRFRKSVLDPNDFLVKGTLLEYDEKLREINSRSDVAVYILLINGISVVHQQEVPESMNDTKDVFEWIDKQKELEDYSIEDLNVDETRKLVARLAEEVSYTVNKPAVYCALVEYEIKHNDGQGKKLTLYHSVESGHQQEVTYRKRIDDQVNQEIQNKRFGDNQEQNLERLISAIRQSSQDVVVDGLSRQLEELRKKLIKIDDQDDMAVAINEIEDNLLLAFDDSLRAHVVRVMLSETLWEENEKLTLRILENVTDSGLDSWLDWLTLFKVDEDSDEVLLKALVGKIDDEVLYWGDNNYLELMKLLKRQIMLDPKYEERQLEYLVADADGSRHIVWDRSYFLSIRLPPIGTNKFSVEVLDNGRVKVTKSTCVDYLMSYYEPTPGVQYHDPNTSYPSHPVWDETSFELGAFELVAFVDRSRLSLLSEAGGTSRGALLMPAIFLAYADEKVLMDEIGTGAGTTMDALTIAIPVSSLYKGSKLVYKILYGVEIGAKVGAIANMPINFDVIDKNSGYATAVNAYNTLLAVVGLTQLSMEGLAYSGRAAAGMFVSQTKNVQKNYPLEDIANPEAYEIMETLYGLANKLDEEGMVQIGPRWLDEFVDALPESVFSNAIQNNSLTFYYSELAENIVGAYDGYGTFQMIPGLDQVSRINVYGTSFDIPAGSIKVYKEGDELYTEVPGFCFPAGTPIRLATGTKAVEEIWKGDQVLSFDHVTKVPVMNQVTKLFKRTASQLTKLLVGGTLLMATPEHQVFANGGYHEIQSLQPGDTLYDADGGLHFVERVTTKDTTLTVYNFEVANTHNYYVGELGLLAHNACNIPSIADRLQGISDHKLPQFKSTLDEIADLDPNVRAALTKKVLDLDDPQVIKTFLDDFAENDVSIKSFLDNPKLVDDWLLNISKIPVSLSATKDVLKSLSNRYANDEITSGELVTGIRKAIDDSSLPAAFKAEVSAISDKNTLFSLFRGEICDPLLDLANSANGELSAYAINLVKIKINVADNKLFLSAITEAEDIVKLELVTGREITSLSGGLGRIFKGVLRGKEAVFKFDRSGKKLYDTVEEIEDVAKSLQSYGGPEVLGRVRMEVDHGIWYEAVAMEYVKGHDLLSLTTMMAQGKTLPMEVTERHIQAIDRTISRLINENKVFDEVNLGDFMLTNDPDRPVVYLDMFVTEGIMNANGPTVLGKPVRESIRDLISSFSVERVLNGLKISGELLEIEDATLLENVVGTLPGSGQLKDVSGLESVSKVNIRGTTFDVAPGSVKVVEQGEKLVTVIPGFCFPAGTPIWLATSIKSVEEVQKGDQVLSFDHVTKTPKLNRVTKLFKRTASQLTKLLVGGTLLMATPDHQVFANDGYHEIQSLHPGDTLYDADGSLHFVERIVTQDTTLTVYNFEVANTHNYYVGELGILAHNACNVPLIADKLQGVSDHKLPQFKSQLDAIADLDSDVRAALTKKALDLDDPQVIKTFLDDFAENNAAIKAFLEEPELVGVWRLLFYADDDLVPAIVRTNPDELGFVKKYADDFPDRYIGEEINEFGSYESWSSDIKQALEKANSHASKGGDVYNKLYIGEVGNTYSETKSMLPGYRGEELGLAALIPWTVPYMSAEKLDECEIFVKNGILFDFKGNLINTTGSEAIFVMDNKGAIFIKDLPGLGRYHHSSFLSGGDVSSAGHIVIEDGILKAINAQTGHYQIPALYNKQLLKELEDRGLPMESVIDFGIDLIDMSEIK